MPRRMLLSGHCCPYAYANELLNTLYNFGKTLGCPVMLMSHVVTRHMLRGCSGLHPRRLLRFNKISDLC